MRIYQIIALLIALVAILIRFLLRELDLSSFIVSTAFHVLVFDLVPSKNLNFNPPETAIVRGIQHRDIVLQNESNVYLRIYAKNFSTVSRPVLLYIHGGGFALGDVPGTNDVCSLFADLTDAIVVSVNYRLAPSHKFPAALEDVQESLIWIESNIDSYGGSRERVAIMGESAGGNLAAAAIATNIDRPYLRRPLKYAFIVYPAIEQGSMRESNFINRNKDGILTMTQLLYFWSLYLNDVNERNDFRACPIQTPDHILARFPPTTMVLAKHDPLLDEGLEFGRRLSANGIDVRVDIYNTTIHGFFGRFGPGIDALKKTAKEFLLAMS